MNKGDKYKRILELRWYDYARRIDRRICATTPYSSDDHKRAEVRLLFAEVFEQFADTDDRYTDPLRDAL